jgi:probable F420-dependent oxidoreductase
MDAAYRLVDGAAEVDGGRMRIGVVYPQLELGSDAALIREFAQRAEGLGYAHVLAFDRVLGASPENRARPLGGPYTHLDQFREPFVLLAFLSAVTSEIELATGVLVLPQRQAALVAKQAAELSLLSGGRLRLGVGAGWGHVEFAGLGQRFDDRGARLEEQIGVLRALWQEPLVDFHGSWHEIDRAAIAPRPAASVPVWLGGMSEAAYARAARLADGFCFSRPPVAGAPDGPVWADAIVAGAARLREHVEKAGRDAAAFPVEGRTNTTLPRDSWAAEVARFRDAGFSHLSVNMMRAGLSAEGHLTALETYAKEVGLT